MKPLYLPQMNSPQQFEDGKRQPRRVDFMNDQMDHACLLYASLGFSTAFICEKTGLSPHQVTYRIGKGGLTRDAGLSRSDFRNGKSPFCGLVLFAAQKVADAELVRHLRKVL